MKTSQLIFIFSLTFLLLFYGETPGINLAVLALLYTCSTYFLAPKLHRTKAFKFMTFVSIVSGLAFAWYGDFSSFLAIVISVLLLRLFALSTELKPILVLPVAAWQGISFPYRFFLFNDWLPKANAQKSVQKIFAVVVIPAILFLTFFAIYTYGSDIFAGFLGGISWDFNIYELVGLSFLGFFIAFNFWNVKIESFIFSSNHHFRDDFVNEDKVAKASFNFLDINLERQSGFVSLLVLNLMLAFFLISFNYEQFFRGESSPAELSGATHERVNSVILSIVMAILVIMFYFKSNFNFDEKATWLRRLAYIWIVLNMLLVLSAATKNLEYISELGLTYKRLGVLAFLGLALLGLSFTFYKIKNRKTNLFLVNKMLWAVYGLVLACSIVNWGALATYYNLKNNKVDWTYLKSLNFNDHILSKENPKYKSPDLIYYKTETKQSSFLSKILYYEIYAQ
ncbi:DUF4153 domain-containing protein [Soonwooa purpurea]